MAGFQQGFGFMGPAPHFSWIGSHSAEGCAAGAPTATNFASDTELLEFFVSLPGGPITGRNYFIYCPGRAAQGGPSCPIQMQNYYHEGGQIVMGMAQLAFTQRGQTQFQHVRDLTNAQGGGEYFAGWASMAENTRLQAIAAAAGAQALPANAGAAAGTGAAAGAQAYTAHTPAELNLLVHNSVARALAEHANPAGPNTPEDKVLLHSLGMPQVEPRTACSLDVANGSCAAMCSPASAAKGGYVACPVARLEAESTRGVAQLRNQVLDGRNRQTFSRQPLTNPSHSAWATQLSNSTDWSRGGQEGGSPPFNKFVNKELKRRSTQLDAALGSSNYGNLQTRRAEGHSSLKAAVEQQTLRVAMGRCAKLLQESLDSLAGEPAVPGVVVRNVTAVTRAIRFVGDLVHQGELAHLFNVHALVARTTFEGVFHKDGVSECMRELDLRAREEDPTGPVGAATPSDMRTIESQIITAVRHKRRFDVRAEGSASAAAPAKKAKSGGSGESPHAHKPPSGGVLACPAVGLLESQG